MKNRTSTLGMMAVLVLLFGLLAPGCSGSSEQASDETTVNDDQDAADPTVSDGSDTADSGSKPKFSTTVANCIGNAKKMSAQVSVKNIGGGTAKDVLIAAKTTTPVSAGNPEVYRNTKSIGDMAPGQSVQIDIVIDTKKLPEKTIVVDVEAIKDGVYAQDIQPCNVAESNVVSGTTESAAGATDDSVVCGLVSNADMARICEMKDVSQKNATSTGDTCRYTGSNKYTELSAEVNVYLDRGIVFGPSVAISAASKSGVIDRLSDSARYFQITLEDVAGIGDQAALMSKDSMVTLAVVKGMNGFSVSGNSRSCSKAQIVELAKLIVQKM